MFIVELFGIQNGKKSDHICAVDNIVRWRIANEGKPIKDIDGDLDLNDIDPKCAN